MATTAAAAWAPSAASPSIFGSSCRGVLPRRPAPRACTRGIWAGGRCQPGAGGPHVLAGLGGLPGLRRGALHGPRCGRARALPSPGRGRAGAGAGAAAGAGPAPGRRGRAVAEVDGEGCRCGGDTTARWQRPAASSTGAGLWNGMADGHVEARVPDTPGGPGSRGCTSPTDSGAGVSRPRLGVDEIAPREPRAAAVHRAYAT
mmetsp:Transcript_83248/g.235834  ORF Transcript_83248/g.235834 Transcript_83248/m.235834 type:complete len:202 (-) Transcript_83248:844-1449(-)